jgi:cytochrome c
MEPTRPQGAMFFNSRDVSPRKIACADCHLARNPLLSPEDDRIRPGHNLWGAFGRGNWWNSRVTTDCGEAAEICFKRFQGGEEFDGRTRTSIVLFLKGVNPQLTSPLILHRRPPGEIEWASGSAERGRDLYRRACAFCHHGGPGSAVDPATSTLTAKEIADLIRLGREGMPFYQGDILTDADVADIAAYAKRLQPPEK